MPQRVTMSRASWVAYWMSEAAPDGHLVVAEDHLLGNRAAHRHHKVPYILSR